VKYNTKFSTWSFKGNQNEIYKCQTNMKPGTTMNMAMKEKKRRTFEKCALNPLILWLST